MFFTASHPYCTQVARHWLDPFRVDVSIETVTTLRRADDVTQLDRTVRPIKTRFTISMPSVMQSRRASRVAVAAGENWQLQIFDWFTRKNEFNSPFSGLHAVGIYIYIYIRRAVMHSVARQTTMSLNPLLGGFFADITIMRCDCVWIESKIESKFRLNSVHVISFYIYIYIYIYIYAIHRVSQGRKPQAPCMH